MPATLVSEPSRSRLPHRAPVGADAGIARAAGRAPRRRGKVAGGRFYDRRVSDLHEPLLEWYDEHARDLPWRRTTATPWDVLVSEVMLQQTPVARVLPVYAAWLARWPDPADLAAAAP